MKTSWNKGTYKHPLGHSHSRVERVCLYCGALFSVQIRRLSQRGGARFCSRQCEADDRRINPPSLRYRRHNLKRNYGLTLERFEEMNAEQAGLCAICGQLPLGKHRILYVDHCHESGRVRGLLCNSCNRALGWFRDRADLLKKAIGYLDRFN